MTAADSGKTTDGHNAADIMLRRQGDWRDADSPCPTCREERRAKLQTVSTTLGPRRVWVVEPHTHGNTTTKGTKS